MRIGCVFYTLERFSPKTVEEATQIPSYVVHLQEGGDRFKEDERKFRRAVFSFERWAAHRSTSRYVAGLEGFQAVFTCTKLH